MRNIRIRSLALIGAASVSISLGLLPAGPPSRAEPVAQEAGIAARYPNDAGIAKDPRVIFADDFDAWETDTAKVPPATWDAVRNSNNPRQRQTFAVAGKVVSGGKE